MAQILIIEDDVECRSALKYLLERNNYSVETAENGTLGVRMYRENPADLVIVDMIMPAKGGPQTILDIKEDYPRVRDHGKSPIFSFRIMHSPWGRTGHGN